MTTEGLMLRWNRADKQPMQVIEIEVGDTLVIGPDVEVNLKKVSRGYQAVLAVNAPRELSVSRIDEIVPLDQRRP